MEMDEDTERVSIREELATMSFEELIKLKEQLGGKAYNEAIFGVKKTTHNLKRENKNRPREISSKSRACATPAIISTKKVVPRDPRFDHLCGEFNDKAFRSSYSFLSDVRTKEKEQLKEELKTEREENKKEQLRYLIQRMENQDREEARHKVKQDREKMEHKTRIEMMRQGKKPQFHKKSEIRALDLVAQFEELKKNGKIHKHIEKQRRKNANRDRKKINIME